MESSSVTLLTLPPHLLEVIQDLLTDDVELPQDLHEQLSLSTMTAAPLLAEDPQGSEDVLPETKEPTAPTTIEADVIYLLARWAITPEGIVSLKRAKLDPSRYILISLLAGTEVYYPESHRDRLLAASNPEKPSPYLPSYLSPSLPSPGSEYRALSKQITTILNVLFSIIGSAAAVYVAAVTGGGYSREAGILFAINAAVVVGIADGVLVWIYANRLDKSRKESRKLAVKLNKGSGADGVVVQEIPAIEPVREIDVVGDAPAELEKKTIRLRRRGIGEQEI